MRHSVESNSLPCMSSVQKIRWIFKFCRLCTIDFFIFCCVMLVNMYTKYVDIVNHFAILVCVWQIQWLDMFCVLCDYLLLKKWFKGSVLHVHRIMQHLVINRDSCGCLSSSLLVIHTDSCGCLSFRHQVSKVNDLSWLLQHDNAPAHRSLLVRIYFYSFKLSLFCHFTFPGFPFILILTSTSILSKKDNSISDTSVVLKVTQV